MAFKAPNQFRARKGKLASTPAFGNNGLFMLPLGEEIIVDQQGNPAKVPFFIVVVMSDAENWEHLSIKIHSMQPRSPFQEEISAIRNKFWDAEDDVFQFYAPDKFIQEPLVVHLFRKPGFPMPVPPAKMQDLKKPSLIQNIAGKIFDA